MEILRQLLDKVLDENFLRATISGKRHGDIAEKVKIRPVMLKGTLYFQTAVSDGKREYHKNYQKEELLVQTEEWLLSDYKQLQLDTTSQSIQAMVSKKGKAAIKKKMAVQKREARVLEHNRKKRYIIEEGTPVPFLVDLGVMTEEGKIVHARYDKFR